MGLLIPAIGLRGMFVAIALVVLACGLLYHYLHGEKTGLAAPWTAPPPFLRREGDTRNGTGPYHGPTRVWSSIPGVRWTSRPDR